MATASFSANTSRVFSPHPLGYIRQWLVTGPRETPYEGPHADDNALRRDTLDRTQVEPPPSALLNTAGPFGEPWRFYYPGENFFVEYGEFYHGLTLIDSYAYTEIESAEGSQRGARLWVSGTADLWVNDTHLTRFVVGRYMHPDFQMVTLPLRQGMNRICVRLQCFGIRDTRNLFGLQMTDPEGLAVHVPGGDSLVDATRWLDSVQTSGRDTVISSVPAPAGASIEISGVPPLAWPAGHSSVSLGTTSPFRVLINVVAEEQTLQRSLEIPANRVPGNAVAFGDLRKTRLEFIGGLSAGKVHAFPLRKEFLPLLARRLSGEHLETDPAALDATLDFIDHRGDCADFALATILRLEALRLTTPEESAKIRRTALSFRYWNDEPGTDAMCFWSENHSLLFHGCQLIAGLLYPTDFFSTSNRTGEAQAALGAIRCREWFDRVEPRGLEEFNSGTYLPITVGALLNVVDFSGDAGLSRRASRLLDHAYEDIALHAFDGVVISPQGRVYRNVLYPEESGTQALLSDATSKAPPDFSVFQNRFPAESRTGDWIVYPASSRDYRPPARLEALMENPASKQYPRGDAEIILHKTPAYLLTSLAIPSSAGVEGKSRSHFLPGMAGYQMLLWQATLGRGCHVFVNHPGCSFDESKSRPGYWYGDGILPRLHQRDGLLQVIYNIPDGSNPPLNLAPDGTPMSFDLYPIPFTHVHWPSDAFDQQENNDHWLFGQKGGGYIAVWCSQALKAHDDVLTSREFQAWGYRSAWVVICGNVQEHDSLEAFIQSCRARQPKFDSATLSIQMEGEDPLFWKT